jgi:hypothetical protein
MNVAKRQSESNRFTNLESSSLQRAVDCRLRRRSGQISTFGRATSTRKTMLFEGGGSVDGPFDTSSTHCEHCGFASALLLILAISQNWGLRHRCTFRWLTDSTAALIHIIRMVRRGPPPRHLPPDSDVWTLICS